MKRLISVLLRRLVAGFVDFGGVLVYTKVAGDETMRRAIATWAAMVSAAIVFSVGVVVPRAAYAQSTSATLSGSTCPGAGCLSVTVAATGQVGVQITGPFNGSLVFEKSVNGAIWAEWPLTGSAGTSATSTPGPGIWTGATDGTAQYRVRFAVHWHGSASVTLNFVPTLSTAAPADDPVSYEVVAIAGTAIGLSDGTIDVVTDLGQTVAYCSGVVEAAPIRMRVDGGTPTSTDGTPVNAGQFLYIGGQTALSRFLAIQTTATTAIWRATCYAG